MTFGVGNHTTLFVNNLHKTLIFTIIGKKNNQSLMMISDADQEMPTLRSMDNAGNLVNLVFRHYPFTLGLLFLSLHLRPMIPYFFDYKTELFSFQNNPKDLDPSCKTDLDL